MVSISMSLSNLNIIVFDSATKEKLKKFNPQQLDEFLNPIVNKIRSDYKKMGNPIDVLELTSKLFQLLEDIPNKFLSLEFAKLKSIESQMLLSIGGSKDILLESFESVNVAIDIFLSSNKISVENNKELIKNTLISAVILKALGEYDLSLNLMRDNAKILLEKRGASKIDLIMLKRQEVMMTQSLTHHKNLLEEANHYKNLNPIEYYSTLKRVLEFSMNYDMYNVAGKIIPELKRSFDVVRNELPQLSHVSFIKNLGQYYLSTNEKVFGEKLILIALSHAEKLNLKGQYKQIKAILNDYELGNKIKLNTFKL